MDTNTYWTLRGDYTQKKNQLTLWPREYLEAVFLDASYNNFIRDCCNSGRYSEFGYDVPISFFGSDWRHIEFSQLDKIPIGTNSSSLPRVGFMVKNKWDFPERYLTIDEARTVISFLDRAMEANENCYFDAAKTHLKELWDYMQTLKFERVVKNSYVEGNFTRQEAQDAVKTLRNQFDYTEKDLRHLQRENPYNLISHLENQDEKARIILAKIKKDIGNSKKIYNKAMIELEDSDCCSECGSENLDYLEQYANGEHWECRDCGTSFFKQ